MTPTTTKSLEEIGDEAFSDLSEEEQLNLVLFPETHTDKVKFCGKLRELRPLPIKAARKLHATLLPASIKLQEAAAGEAVTSVDDIVLDALLAAGKHLCAYYEWEDAKQKVEDEDYILSDLQLLLIVQSNLNGANDFLLTPARVLITVMRIAEIAAQQVAINLPGKVFQSMPDGQV